MSGRAVIVTGASNGIGRAIRHRLASQGALVLNLDAKPPEPDAMGVHYAIDLSDEAATIALLDHVCAAHDVLELVNCAGVVFGKPFEEQTLEELDQAIAVNMTAPLLCVNAVLPAMRRMGYGRIVNIASRTVSGRAERTAYGMTKGGLLAMTRSLALELAPSGITVNAIGPGPIETELFRLGNPPGAPRAEKNLRAVPMGRFGQPEEVAHAVAFFLDERSSFITGQILMVDGGQTLGVQPS